MLETGNVFRLILSGWMDFGMHKAFWKRCKLQNIKYLVIEMSWCRFNIQKIN